MEQPTWSICEGECEGELSYMMQVGMIPIVHFPADYILPTHLHPPTAPGTISYKTSTAASPRGTCAAASFQSLARHACASLNDHRTLSSCNLWQLLGGMEPCIHKLNVSSSVFGSGQFSRQLVPWLIVTPIPPA